jgi:hypothetical protein
MGRWVATASDVEKMQKRSRKEAWHYLTDIKK